MSRLVSTFSIVAFDPATDSLGVAVQSKFLGVGSVVPWARAGVGAVATQALANYSYGPEGLELLSGGESAAGVVEALTSRDPEREQRQLGVVDAAGRAATFTGGECFEWAGGLSRENYAAQGNILVSGETVEAMAKVFEDSRGEFPDRLLAALAAGQGAGGDSRGRQSAALLVVREGAGYGGDNDRAVDLRVDDHPEPIDELARLYALHRLYFGQTLPGDVVRLEGEVEEEVRGLLSGLGYDARDLPGALAAFIHTENFEEREQEGGYLDRAVLKFMREKDPG